jgi:hypothetical protein
VTRRRNTPWVLGCWGPTLTVMGSVRMVMVSFQVSAIGS